MGYDIKYGGFNLTEVKRYIRMGQQSEAQSEEELVNSFYDRVPLMALELIEMGYYNKEFDVASMVEREFYRIGEPAIEAYAPLYLRSFNHAEDRREAGVSVVSSAWLHSLKSVFYGTYDDKLAARGVYKIKGVKLPCKGGDDEPLIYPTDWAQRTNIRTRTGLERAVKQLERVQIYNTGGFAYEGH